MQTEISMRQSFMNSCAWKHIPSWQFKFIISQVLGRKKIKCHHWTRVYLTRGATIAALGLIQTHWVFTTCSPGPGICMEGGKEKEIRLSINRNVWGKKGPEVVGRKNRISSWRISPTNSTLLIEFVKCQLYRCLCSLFLFFRQSPCLKTWHSYKRVGFWLPDFVKFWIQVPSLSNLPCECGWHILWNGMLVISI